jgi:pSer/pThr/pTyr-binding forkhead associated (FHA) protein
MLKLIIETEDGELTVVRVAQDEVTIGRNQSNTICLTEQNVSRQHARVYRENGACYVEDTNSHNGILLNGSPLAGRAEIRDGDNFQIGDYLLGLRPPEQGADLVEDTDRIVLPKPEAAAQAPKPPRLVFVSVGFEGKEVRLEQDVIVIGRANDNDIILEHWSIWPHHARLSRNEQGVYSIDDLHGPNSVRINGRPEESIELRAGDIIDLGQVQIRFCGAGEEFVYKPPKPRLPRSAIWLGACVGTVVLGATLLTLRTITRPRHDEPASVPAKPEPPAVAFAHALAKVDDEMRKENWMSAIDLCRHLEPQDTGGACRPRRMRAESEQSAKTSFMAFREAAERGDTDVAVARYQTIPEDSVYRTQAQVLWPVVRQSYSKLYLGQAMKAASTGRCDEARALAGRVASVDAENEGLPPIRKRCPAPAAAPPRPAPVAAAPKAAPKPAAPSTTAAPAKAERAAPEKPAGEAPPAKGETPAEAKPPEAAAPAAPAPAPEGPSPAAALVEQAQLLYFQGQYTKAIQVAQKALKLVPGDAKSVNIIGVSSCNLKDKEKAAWAYERLNAANQQLLVTVCGQNGITVP